jgi:hypothetical protein
MALRTPLLALGIAAAAPALAETPVTGGGVPPGTEETRYCMRVAAFTGSRVERIRCWTREQWAEQGVDLDRDWAKEGVRVL